ncbi:hypothetical protein AMECASPLE_039194 [Ameca splendens]|uniref:Exodeoxyribonuclease X-like C-terminal domain-containing protein n=1 Tax=Ameca splendens TaxID=208324 RepID=A0ABV0Y8F4_9TELE
MKRKLIFPGKIEVSFRRGPTGYLRQDPSDEAKRIKDNPDLQDQSAPLREAKVKENGHSIVFLRGGDVSDRQEVLGEYVLQFGKYKGKTFRWVLENDVGYIIYLINKVEEEERMGQFKPEGPKKDSLVSFLEYSRTIQEIEDLVKYLSERTVEPLVTKEEDNLVALESIPRRLGETYGKNGRMDMLHSSATENVYQAVKCTDFNSTSNRDRHRVLLSNQFPPRLMQHLHFTFKVCSLYS